MKSSELPSLFVALARRFALEAGIDPDHLLAVACGETEDVELARRLVTALHPLVLPSDFLGLPSASISATIENQMQASNAVERKTMGRPPIRAPFTDWLRSIGKTADEWSEEHGISRLTLKGWYTPGGYKKGSRKIPRERALEIQREAGKDKRGKWILPATDATWPNGIQ